MKAAYILYDNLTLLDFVGLYDPLSQLPVAGPSSGLYLGLVRSHVHH